MAKHTEVLAACILLRRTPADEVQPPVLDARCWHCHRRRYRLSLLHPLSRQTRSAPLLVGLLLGAALACALLTPFPSRRRRRAGPARAGAAPWGFRAESSSQPGRRSRLVRCGCALRCVAFAHHGQQGRGRSEEEAEADDERTNSGLPPTPGHTSAGTTGVTGALCVGDTYLSLISANGITMVRSSPPHPFLSAPRPTSFAASPRTQQDDE